MYLLRVHLDHTVHRGQVGVSPGSETFSDLDFADDVTLLTEMLSVCILAMEIMQEEAAIFGIEINWLKAKIQMVGTRDPTLPECCTCCW